MLVDSGGTGGLLGFLLYREAGPAPRLVLAWTGYKLGVAVEGNKLVIHEPNYVGFEANCCPSSTTRTLNALEGDRLVTLATETEPNDVQEPTVWSFYMALGEQRYEDAYEFHSPAYQAEQPVRPLEGRLRQHREHRSRDGGRAHPDRGGDPVDRHRQATRRRDRHAAIQGHLDADLERREEALAPGQGEHPARVSCS